MPRPLSAPQGQGLDVITALACASPSDCSAVGTYLDRSGKFQLYAVTERHGLWGKGRGIAVPASLRGGDPAALVLSCASAGNCAAGSSLTGDVERAFVVSQANDSWGTVQPVRGAASGSRVFAISCPSPGECVAAGGYVAFLVSQAHGHWGLAFRVPGLAALSKSQESKVTAISCPSPGNCGAGGTYAAGGTASGAFVVSDTRGIWGTAQQIRGTSGFSTLDTLSCTSAGNCVAGGYSHRTGAYVATEKDGTWGTARTVPGTSGLRGAEISQLSCPAPGQCSAFGVFDVTPKGRQPFVATEKNGTWHAQTLTGAGPGSDLRSLACAGPGNCLVGGRAPIRIAGRSKTEAVLAAEVNGRWTPTRLLHGVLALDRNGYSQINEVSCPALSSCTAIGTFTGKNGIGSFVSAQN